jgi:hypothetical protein
MDVERWAFASFRFSAFQNFSFSAFSSPVVSCLVVPVVSMLRALPLANNNSLRDCAPAQGWCFGFLGFFGLSVFPVSPVSPEFSDLPHSD